MKLPRDINAEELIKALGYKQTRQTGSHIRLSIQLNSTEHSLTIPNHKPIRIGTLNNIILDITKHLNISKNKLILGSGNHLYSTESKELLLSKSYFDGAKILFHESQKEENQSKTFSNVIYPCLFLLHQSLELSLKAHLQVIVQNIKGFKSDLPEDTQTNEQDIKGIYQSHNLCKVLQDIEKITKDSSNHNHEELLKYEYLFKWFDQSKSPSFRFIRDNKGEVSEFHEKAQDIPAYILKKVEEVINLLQYGYYKFNFHEKNLGYFDTEERGVIRNCLSLLKNIYDQFPKELLRKASEPQVYYSRDLNFESNPLKENFRAYLSQQNIEDLRKALVGYYFLRGDDSCSQLLKELSCTSIQSKLEDKLVFVNIQELESTLAQFNRPLAEKIK